MSEAEQASVPCLIPVQLTVSSGEVSRGFMTRLGPSSATVSADPVPPEGTRIQLNFRRPTDNQEVTIEGSVGEMLTEGGLWRGREAMLVLFDDSVSGKVIPKDEGAEIRKQMSDERRGSEPSRLGPSPTASLGGALTASGRGRRRRPSSSLVSESLLETMDAPPVATPRTEPDIETLAPGRLSDSRSLRDQLSVGPKGPKKKAQPTQPSSGSTDDDDFFGRFKGEGTVGTLPPVLDDAEFGSKPPSKKVEDLLATSNQPPVSDIPPVQDITSPYPATRKGGPAPTRAQTAVPVAGSSPPPWEADSEDASRSLIPRHVRIASSLEVTFWSRGRQHKATAQNFSREGAFLAYNGDPPIRGAIVRIEFPIDWSRDAVPVRFNAEVRWHRADQPGANVPEGFGVQILTFESPKDQGRYDEMLMVLLDLDNKASKTQGPAGYRWGAPNPS